MNFPLFVLSLFSIGLLEPVESNQRDFHAKPIAYETVTSIASQAVSSIVCASIGNVLTVGAQLAKVGWLICLPTSYSSTVGNEWKLFSDVLSDAACAFYSQGLKAPISIHHKTLHASWDQNQALLSSIELLAGEEKELFAFLQNRWLAKSTGLYSLLNNWVFPAFGILLQSHPEISSYYARRPSNKSSNAYLMSVEACKKNLPHPTHFPLILTRPADLQAFLPGYVPLSSWENLDQAVASWSTSKEKIILDVTKVMPQIKVESEKWLEIWQTCQLRIRKSCQKHQISPERLVCIEQIGQGGIGGIRILPIAGQAVEAADKNYQHLFNWISVFGLSATRVELDRGFSPFLPESINDEKRIYGKLASKNAFTFFLQFFEKNWGSLSAGKNTLVKGTVQTLKGLVESISDENWRQVAQSKTKSLLVEASFFKIVEQLNLLLKDPEEIPFFQTTEKNQLIHTNLSALLEVFSPFCSADFNQICKSCSSFIPVDLTAHTSFGVHSSGMTCLLAALKGTEKVKGDKLNVLYGEHSYFECVEALGMVANTKCTKAATENDWREVDLILAQFNPALSHVGKPITEYAQEKVSNFVRLGVRGREGKPLTLALDCTLDYIGSPAVMALLQEFEAEILNGSLAVICYRSGIKYDLFGMDNYSGAPFYTIHNTDPQWSGFDAVVTDPALQTDLLSMNWFCLAHKYAFKEIEDYRRAIFENTKSVLRKVNPQILHDQGANYRVVAFEKGIEPSFIDIRVAGPFHEHRANCLVIASTLLEFLKAGHPLFFRPGLGFYHANIASIVGEESTSVRLTLGIDPSEVDLIVRCIDAFGRLNGFKEPQ